MRNICSIKLLVQIGLIEISGFGMRKFLRSLGRKKSLQIKESLVDALEALAEENQRDVDEFTEELIALGVAHKQQAVENLSLWDKLTPREKEVVALVCLGYMNKEIGEKLYISPQTVKTHVSNALRKFGVKKRGEIQRLLANWDFRDWDR
jgi:DNA-binding NarL/FixJ family response regulator